MRFKLSKKVLLLLFLLSILSLVLTFTFVTKKRKEILEKPTPQFIAPPKIPNYFEEKLSIKVNVEEKDFNFPEKMPLLKQENTLAFTESFVRKIALNLGFNDQPLKLTDVKNGELYIWNKKDYSLMIFPKIKKIKLVPADNPANLIENAVNKQISEEGYLSLAEEFLTQKIEVSGENLNFSGYTYLKTEKGLELFRKTDKETSEILQLNFFQSDSEYPIYLLNAQDTQITVQFLKDGSLLNFEALLLANIKRSESEYRIKDYQEFIEKAYTSILVSLNDSNINLADLNKDSLDNIEINKVFLVYLLDSSLNQSFQPVFLLEGEARVSGYSGKISASFYLPAFSEK